MEKVSLNLIEQQRLIFLKNLKTNMLNLNISKATISFEDMSNYATLKIEKIELSPHSIPDLEHSFKTDLHNFRGIYVDVKEYQEKEYVFKIKSQLIHSLASFNKTQFIKNFLFTKKANFFRYDKETYTFTLNDTFLGMDFNDFDTHLMMKMEQATLNKNIKPVEKKCSRINKQKI
jgi:hypothetical protein